MADLAGHGHVGQELHLYLVVAIALAGLTTASFDVEGKPARSIPPYLGFRQVSEQFPDRCECPGIRGRVAAGRSSDGRLVDVDDFVDVFHPNDFLMLAGQVAGAVDQLGETFVQNVVDQGALTRTGNPGDTHQPAQRKLNVNLL